MDKELLKGNLDIVLLLLLSNKTMYGYEISKEIRDITNDSCQLGEGTLYPALKRLEDKNYLETYWEQVEGKDVKRKFYRATKSGLLQLKIKLESWRQINTLIEKSLIKGVFSNESN